MILVYYTHVNGVKSFVWHLCRGLRASGLEFELVKLHRRDENTERQYAPDLTYRNVSWNTVRDLKKKHPMLIATTSAQTAERTDDLCGRGARVVIHSNIAGDTAVTRNVPIIIHRSLSQWVDGVFLPHPYCRRFHREKKHKKIRHAAAITRLDPRKGTDVVLEAMRHRGDIDLYGDLMPFYGMELDRRFPWWRGRWRGKFALGLGPEIAEDYQYVIDLTNRGAECGTQYTFFEAADAGATPVIHELWCQNDAEEMIHRQNCLAVSSAIHLASLPKRSPVSREDLRGLLDAHDAGDVAKKWWRELR